MDSFTTFFLWALFTCILRQGSFAEDQSGYICLIDDPKQNQCDSICLTELSPRLSEVVKAQNEGNTNTRNAVNEIKSKLETLEAKMEGQLQGVENKLEGRLQGVENKLEGRLQGLERQLQEGQTKLEAKLDKSLAVQEKIENQLQGVLNKLQLVQNKMDSTEVKSELQAKSNKTAAPQQADKVAVPALPTISIPPGFELIGSRYFRIVKEREEWQTAERRCREMGGYLASFRNKEEIKAIIPKIDWSLPYWLGINDQENEGHFVSVASQKPAQFLKWLKREPNDSNHKENCVYLYSDRMGDANGYTNSLPFICQADNET